MFSKLCNGCLLIFIGNSDWIIVRIISFDMAGQHDVLPSDYNPLFSQIHVCYLSQNTLDQERVLVMLIAGELVSVHKNQHMDTHVQVIKMKVFLM